MKMLIDMSMMDDLDYWLTACVLLANTNACARKSHNIAYDVEMHSCRICHASVSSPPGSRTLIVLHGRCRAGLQLHGGTGQGAREPAMADCARLPGRGGLPGHEQVRRASNDFTASALETHTLRRQMRLGQGLLRLQL